MTDAGSQSTSFRFRMRAWLRRPGNIAGVIGVVIGLVGGIGVPVWQIFFIQKPELSIEINSINRAVKPEATLPLNDEFLSVLFGDRESRRATIPGARIVELYGLESGAVISRHPAKSEGYTPENVSLAFEAAKQELRALPDRIESRKQELARVKALASDTLSYSDVSRLNRPISPEIVVDREEFDRKSKDRPSNTAYFSRLHSEFLQAYQKRSDSLESRYTELQTQLPELERKFEEMNDELLKKRSFFTVSAALLNSGRASTSIKRPGLLRIYIGTGNYVDLKMLLQEYETSAEVKSHGTQIVTFRSEEISTLPESDQGLINTYWGQSVHAILFVEDILGKVHSSNRIAFSEGLYQKIIYDRLSTEASKVEYF